MSIQWRWRLYVLSLAAVSLCAVQIGCSMGAPGELGTTQQAATGCRTCGLCGNYDEKTASLKLDVAIKTVDEILAALDGGGGIRVEIQTVNNNKLDGGGGLRREIQVIRNSLAKQCTSPTPTAGTSTYDECLAGYEGLIQRLTDDGQPLVEVARKIAAQNELLLQQELDALKKQCSQ